MRAKKGTGISVEREEKRVLGLIIIRGDSVVSMTIEGPPPPEDNATITPGGPGVARAAGRGLPVAPMGSAPIGLSGPVRGVGGPGPAIMMPPVPVAAQMGVAYPRPMPIMPPGMGMPGMPMPPGMIPPPGMPRPMMGMPPPPGMIPGFPPGMPPAPPGMPRMMPPGPPAPRGG